MSEHYVRVTTISAKYRQVNCFNALLRRGKKHHCPPGPGRAQRSKLHLHGRTPRRIFRNYRFRPDNPPGPKTGRHSQPSFQKGAPEKTLPPADAQSGSFGAGRRQSLCLAGRTRSGFCSSRCNRRCNKYGSRSSFSAHRGSGRLPSRFSPDGGKPRYSFCVAVGQVTFSLSELMRFRVTFSKAVDI